MTTPDEDSALDQIRGDLDQLLAAHDPDADPARFLADDMDEAITKQPFTRPWPVPAIGTPATRPPPFITLYGGARDSNPGYVTVWAPYIHIGP